MKILVNTRLLIPDKLAGIAWFTLETLKRITNEHKDVQFYFVFDRKFSDEFIFSNNIEPLVLSPPTRHPVLWYFWFEHRLPQLINKIKPDLFLSPDGYLSLKAKVRSLLVIHDINFHHYPNDFPLSSNLFYNYFVPKYAQKATRLASVSEFSKADIHKHYGIAKEKIDVVYNGYNSVYKPISDIEKQRVKLHYTKGRDFFIFVGSLSPRKNIENMMLAYQYFIDNSDKIVDLVIVGDNLFMTKSIKKTWQNLRNKDNIHFTGRLAPDEISELTASAIALVLVSKLEGFGIPVIEAFACKTPVIVSNVSSLPEIAEDAAIYVNPFSVKSIGNAFLKMSNDEQLRKKLADKTLAISKKYSWNKSSKLLWQSILNSLNTQ